MKLILSSKVYAFARRLERANLRARGTSLTAGSIARAANSHIVEIVDGGWVRIRDGWKDAMKRAAESH